MNLFATIWVAIITIIFCLPFRPEAVPWNSSFEWEAFNYAPAMVGIVVLGATITWFATARKHFTGQVREVELDEEIGPEPTRGPVAP
jgi:hypothetical protein